MSIVDMLEGSLKKDSRIYGVVVGVVTNNKDPDKLARVKVKFPRLSADTESDWIRIATLMAGKKMGSFFLPEIDDEVLIAFEHGDANMPYVIGSLWNGKDKPPEDNSDGKNNIRMIQSRSGHVIKFDDKDGKEKIEIIDKSKKNKITIDTKSNKISIESSKDIEIKAPKGKVTIEGKEIQIKSKTKMLIEAKAQSDIKTSATMNIKGAMVNIN